jgi:signal transduction histidine kinase
MKRYSIARRLIVAVLLVEFVSAICITSLALIYERHAHYRSFEIMLRGRADSLIGAVQDAEDPEDNVMLDKADFVLPSEDIYEVRDEKGRLLGRSANWSGPESTLIATSKDSLINLVENGRSYRAIVVHGVRVVDPGDKGGGITRHVTVIYGSPTKKLWHAILGAVRFFAIASLLLMAITGIAMAWLLHRGLAPLRELAAEASKVSSKSWHFEPTEEVRATNELAPLANALENVLAELEQSFLQQRRFTSDAAHELKTAVAVMKSSLQLLEMKPRTAEEYRAGLERCATDCSRIEEIVVKMLTVARFENAIAQAPVTTSFTNLEECLRQMLSQFESMAQLRKASINFQIPELLFARISEEDCRLLFSNLLLNALQHSPADTQITMQARAERKWITITVADKGDGIFAEDIPHIFERFYRADPSRNRNTGGSGLGLAICKAIVEAANGEITISSKRGEGTSVSVKLLTSEVSDSHPTETSITAEISPSA